jgi:hypothetical protein
MSDTRQPAEEDERGQEVCGEAYDHDIPARDYEDFPEGPWTCRRSECGAEIWPEEC